MDVTKNAVDAAASLLGPYLQHDRTHDANPDLNAAKLVDKALHHLRAINAADLAAHANALYDASLAGIVYGLLDMVTLLGIIPNLSPGVAFSQRPKSVLSVAIAQVSSAQQDDRLLAEVIETFLPILEQNGTGVQPLLSQRILPDVVTALAELSLSPTSKPETRPRYLSEFQRIVWEVPTSRLLPILTTLLQQPLPPWLKPTVSHELSIVPLRAQGVRHVVEFLSLSCLSQNSKAPHDASGPQSQIPIPREAITQASRLLVLPPTGTSQSEWLRKLTPQLLGLLDGVAGKELISAAGQIIAEGILSKKTTGAPGTVGWDLFAMPILQKIYPKKIEQKHPHGRHRGEVLVQDLDLKLALKRLFAISTLYSHAGVLRRLVGPLLFPLWALLNFAKARPSLEKEWTVLPQAILSQYVTVACDAKLIDKIFLNLFWDGDSLWTFGPGSHGGVEIRRRSEETSGLSAMDSILSRVGDLNTRTELLSSLLADADVPDETAGTIFLQVTKRWLSPAKKTTTSLTKESDLDLLAPLIDAKLSETLATKFKDKLARSPRHVIELMGQVIQNAVDGYKLRVQAASRPVAPSRVMFENIVRRESDKVMGTDTEDDETTDDDLVSYALSVLNTLVSSSGFKHSLETTASLHAILPSLLYIGQDENEPVVPPLIRNSASALFHLISTPTSSAPPSTMPPIDALRAHRATLKEATSELTSLEPPNRAWALNTIKTLIRNPTAFPVIDIPSLTHTLLSVSLSDPDSYVHTAAAPVLLELAVRAPPFVVQRLTDSWTDANEESLVLGPSKDQETALQNALDFRLRIGEVLNTILLSPAFNPPAPHTNPKPRFNPVHHILAACLALAGRRTHRPQTHAARRDLASAARRTQAEIEAAWGGAIPNVLEPAGRDAKDQADIDALSGVLREWGDTGVEDDVRIRASALSVLSVLLEWRLDVVGQGGVDASLQVVLTLLSMERSEGKAVLRRAGVLVVLGLLRGVDSALKGDRGGGVDVSVRQEQEVERVVGWVRDEDVDGLARDHAVSVMEGLETLRMKRVFKMRDAGLSLGPNLELEGGLRGLEVRPGGGGEAKKRRIVVEELD